MTICEIEVKEKPTAERKGKILGGFDIKSQPHQAFV